MWTASERLAATSGGRHAVSGMKSRSAVLCITCMFVLAAVPAHAVSCAEAARSAEQTWGLPPGLLLAIGDVESGLTPYALNVEGRPIRPDSMADAVVTVRTHQSAGVKSIDVGCFQINLRWHPTAFAFLEQAFDPTANALYAARYLSELYGQSGSWTNAVGLYHSANAGFQDAYRGLVIARIRAMRDGVALGTDGARTGTTPPHAAGPPRLQTDMRSARAAAAFVDVPAATIARTMRISADLPLTSGDGRLQPVTDDAYPARRAQ